MQIENLVKNQEIDFNFRKHHFHIFRDNDDDVEVDADWYIEVTDHGSGMHAYDGWFRDSEYENMKSAIIEACKGSCIELPRRWPKELGNASP